MADFLKIFKQVSHWCSITGALARLEGSAPCQAFETEANASSSGRTDPNKVASLNLIKSLVCITAASLSACEALNPPVPGTDVNFAPTYASPIDPRQIKNADGSIYHAETALPLFETPRARHPGDIVTVILIEKTDAKKQATTRSMKNDKIGIAVPEFLGKPISIAGGYNLDFNVNAQRQFNGDTQAVQNNKLAGAISVTVAKEFSNGNLFIQGEKWIQINQGKEFVRLSGIIRPQDIKADNTITSDRVANARMYYGGVGQVNNTNAQGWFSRFLWGPLYLF